MDFLFIVLCVLLSPFVLIAATFSVLLLGSIIVGLINGIVSILIKAFEVIYNSIKHIKK